MKSSVNMGNKPITMTFALENELPQDLYEDFITNEKFIDYDYPAFHLTMHCILCTIISGELRLL